MFWPPVHQLTPLPFEQCPADRTNRRLDVVRPVKPIEQPAPLRKIVAPARRVQSHATREVQPASSCVRRFGSIATPTPAGAALAAGRCSCWLGSDTVTRLF